MKEKFIGNPKEVDILCPTCGTKTTGKVSEEKKSAVSSEELGLGYAQELVGRLLGVFCGARDRVHLCPGFTAVRRWHNYLIAFAINSFPLEVLKSP